MSTINSVSTSSSASVTNSKNTAIPPTMRMAPIIEGSLESPRITRNNRAAINSSATRQWVDAAAGAAEILYKPVQMPELRGVLRNYLLAC